VSKNFGDTQIDGTGGGGVGGSGSGGGPGGSGNAGNFQQLATGETHLADSFGDDISDIDVDVDLTAPVPLSSLSSRNEVSLNQIEKDEEIDFKKRKSRVFHKSLTRRLTKS